MKVKLITKTSAKSGNLVNEYNPLQNLTGEKGYFDTDKIQFDLNHPLEIECQPSYDNSVNLIMVDDKNPPLLVNSAFSVKENHTFEVVDRNQTEQTNIYNEDKLKQQAALFRYLDVIPRFNLLAVMNDGCLKGGNYTFYLRLADNDYNKSDVVAESSIISIFKGDANNISGISGTLMDELTDKTVKLQLCNIDKTFSKAYLSYKRSYADLNGVLLEEYKELIEPYHVTSDEFEITINGYENVNTISEEDLNVRYNVYDAVKTQAQVQNMLFFGNVQEPIIASTDLQQEAYKIKVKCIQKTDSIGYVYTDYTAQSVEFAEYYNPINTYSSLGYWPEEYYRIGVVFIFKNDSLSPVYNLLGLEIKELNKNNIDDISFEKIDTSETLIEIEGKKYNTKGVFKLPFVDIQQGETTKPLGFKFDISELNLDKFDIKGLFFVRQARVPTILAQGISMGIVDGTSTPALYDPSPTVKSYFTECFDSLYHKGCDLKTHNTRLKTIEDHNYRISKDGPECLLARQLERRVCYSNGLNCYGYPDGGYLNKFYNEKQNPYACQCRSILCADAHLNKSLQSIFDGSKFSVKPLYNTTMKSDTTKRVFQYVKNQSVIGIDNKVDLAYMPENTALRIINKQRFASQCGSAEKASSVRSVHYKYYNNPEEWEKEWPADKKNKYNPNDKKFVDLVRGNFAAYIAVLNNGLLDPGLMYNIYVNDSQEVETQIKIRGADETSFVRISDRYSLSDWDKELEIFGGDCFTNTVTVQMQTNFIDNNTPTNEILVDNHMFHALSPEDGKEWSENEELLVIDKRNDESELSKKYSWVVKPTAKAWEKVQLGDWNAVDLGHWVTYKCLSNFNLGLRVENDQYVDEKARMGTSRSFYPKSGGNVSASIKVPDSDILNAGLSSTLSAKKYFEYKDLPYTKSMFDNRIAFSNIQVEEDFKNAYRVFQGLSYDDIERQYGSIVKLLEYGTDLFCVFEHGCAIIPINEKALMQTTMGQSIHMYGAGVLPEKVTPISTNYGSTWQESIIKTANGIYGVDSVAKKIWRFNATGFSIISDTLVQRFLNDNLILSENDKQPIIAFKNIKTHYNAHKNDVMFTFYNGSRVWNLCYNERIEKWTTKYSWTPLCSESINNSFISIDRERSKIYSYVHNNKTTEKGLRAIESGDEGCLFIVESDYVLKHQDFKIVGYDVKKYLPKIKHIQVDFIENGQFVTKILDSGFIHSEQVSSHPDMNISVVMSNEHQDCLQLKVETNNMKLISIMVNLDLIADDVKINEDVALVVDYDSLSDEDKLIYDPYVRNGLFVHGRSGIYDEIDYFDCDLDNQIKPTFWYNKQEPFEFEFVVNQPTGIHKIFNNLVMISNNVEPDSLEIEIVGDVYGFDKEAVYKYNDCEEHSHDLPKTDFVTMTPVKDKYYKTDVTWDPILNQYMLKTHQDVLNINDYGRRIGNMQYKEDAWYMTLQPIYHKLTNNSKLQSTRIRDKFARIRIKYKGDKLVIINAIQTLANVSYS